MIHTCVVESPLVYGSGAVFALHKVYYRAQSAICEGRKDCIQATHLNLHMSVQTYANLVSVYMEDDVNTELTELEEFRKQLEPTSMANQSKLRTMQTDLQV